jgi:hypothetical protein
VLVYLTLSLKNSQICNVQYLRPVIQPFFKDFEIILQWLHKCDTYGRDSKLASTTTLSWLRVLHVHSILRSATCAANKQRSGNDNSEGCVKTPNFTQVVTDAMIVVRSVIYK